MFVIPLLFTFRCQGFCFVLHEGLKEVVASDEVRAAIAEKISRERIGHEVCVTLFLDVDITLAGSLPDFVIFFHSIFIAVRSHDWRK